MFNSAEVKKTALIMFQRMISAGENCEKGPTEEGRNRQSSKDGWDEIYSYLLV